MRSGEGGELLGEQADKTSAIASRMWIREVKSVRLSILPRKGFYQNEGIWFFNG
jgi:hypothetical protein